MDRFWHLILGLSLTLSLSAEDVAVVSFSKGEVYISSPRFKTGRETIKLGSILQKGDTLVSKEGVCEIQLATQATIRTSHFTELKIDEILDPKTNGSHLQLVGGKLFVKAHKEEGQNRQLTISSPSYVAGVRGTEFLLSTPGSGGEDESLKLDTGVFVNEGSVAVKPEASASEVLVNGNEEIVSSGKEMTKQILNEFAKEKMRIFEEFKKIKKENYERIKEQNRKNSELLNEFKNRQVE